MSWVLLTLIPITGYLAFQVGIRIERGRREKELDALEETRYQRGIRGTVRLSSMKIRR